MKLFPKSVGPYPYLWMLIIFPQFFYNALHVDHLTNRMITVMAGIILIYVFRQMYWLDHSALLIHFQICLAALCVSSVIIDPSMMFYGLGFVFLFGYIERVRDLVLGIVSLTLVYIIVSAISDGSPIAFIRKYQFILFIIQAVIPIAVFLYERTRKLHHQLNQANEQIVSLVKEQERNRFARDLHDTLGHTLTMVILKCELATRLMDKESDQAKLELSEIEAITRTALRQTRELVTSIKYRSLQEELEDTKRFLQNKRISVSVDSPENWPQLGTKSETMLSLALREAVTNVARHSDAKRCTIKIMVQNQKFCLVVDDDGVGFEGDGSAGNGLHTMQERMMLIGGSVEFVKKEPGTTLRFQLPLKKRKVEAGTCES
ncbi:sensor histidine kinase [Sporolactobacillus terrae]|uniref:sensor histidine kinase n=1 Tax=Sporolactobacillus terrae TaxID=269673 RepID=UPI000687B4DF|nr:sensor histidine kinase [Sporolactobacillus terrae]